MTPGARVAAAISILDQIAAGDPAEKVLTNWGRSNRYAGSKDRAAIRDHVYDVLRRWRSAAWLGGGESGRQLMAGVLRLQGTDPATLFTGDGYAPDPLRAGEEPQTGAMPDAVAADLPDWLFAIFAADLGDDLAAVIEHSQQRAPVFLRVARAKGSVAQARAALETDGIATELVPGVDTALRVLTNPKRVQNSTAYLSGQVELQDAGAQRLCLDFPLKDGDLVLDYCAGGGGKALALADRAQLRVTAYDAAPKRMQDLPVRAARAGQHIDIARNPAQGAPYDLVLCDVPCSGSGTWRRAPEAKWQLTKEQLAALGPVQQGILGKAAALVGPGGVLAYATCSVFHRENRAVIDGFVADHPGWSVEFERSTIPGNDGDGFYLCFLRRA